MKRPISFFLALVLLCFSLFSCGVDADKKTDEKATTNENEENTEVLTTNPDEETNKSPLISGGDGNETEVGGIQIGETSPSTEEGSTSEGGDGTNDKGTGGSSSGETTTPNNPSGGTTPPSGGSSGTTPPVSGDGGETDTVTPPISNPITGGIETPPVQIH